MTDWRAAANQLGKTGLVNDALADELGIPRFTDEPMMSTEAWEADWYRWELEYDGIPGGATLVFWFQNRPDPDDSRFIY